MDCGQMNICICLGPDWADKVLVQSHAIFRTQSRRVKLYLVSEQLTDADIQPFKELAKQFNHSVEYVDLERFFKKKFHGNKQHTARFTKYTLYRLAVPFVINETRILYLDADTLVQKDLSSLYDMDLGGNFIAGAVDTGIAPSYMRKYGMNPTNPYINAGVILMDLAKIRTVRIGEKWVSLARTRRYPCNDQDIINVSLGGKIKIIPPVYNCSLSTKTDVPIPDIVIMHYAGVKDPWVANLPNAHLWDSAEELYHAHRIASTPVSNDIINRVICYGWFGRSPKPPKIQSCIDSWKICGYEVIELNEDTCDVNETEFTKLAYSTKKYAYVADYFRMKAMYERGCITLDADVQLLKPLDAFLKHRFFSGQEINDKILITAVMGAEKGHPIVRMILEYYQIMEFNPARPAPNTGFITEILKLFVKERTNRGIVLHGGGFLYPQSYFCNFDHKKMRVIHSKDSHAVHHFQGSWKK